MNISGERNRCILGENCQPVPIGTRIIRWTEMIFISIGIISMAIMLHKKDRAFSAVLTVGQNRLETMKAPKAKRTRGRPVTHGLSRTKAYRSWHWITYCSKEPYFAIEYYGYPISLCKEWRGKKGMTQFYQDMGERPEYAQLKVTDVEQQFSKSNCYWERRPEQLTKEQSNELNQMIQYISDHRDWLDRWESGFCKRINNYVKRGCPITIHCFIKVKSIFEKLSSRERLSTSNTSNHAPVY